MQEEKNKTLKPILIEKLSFQYLQGSSLKPHKINKRIGYIIQNITPIAIFQIKCFSISKNSFTSVELTKREADASLSILFCQFQALKYHFPTSILPDEIHQSYLLAHPFFYRTNQKKEAICMTSSFLIFTVLRSSRERNNISNIFNSC